MASGNSSLESNGSNESMSNEYQTPKTERLNQSQIPTIPRDYDILAPSQSYEQQNYSTVPHGMSGAYEYELANSKQSKENLKQQCEKALHDLNHLRRQHSETSRRCEHAMKELEYFRGQHRAAMSQLEVSASEANSLRGKYGELLNDKQRLEREVSRLLEGGATAAGGDQADVLVMTLHKYDQLKEEYECFQKRYEELITNHNQTLEKLQMVQEENSRLKSQCHELTQERNAVVRERNGLKAQVASVLRSWEGGVRERERGSLRLAPHLAPRLAPPDLARLADERNAALHEYTLIMSERDTVHKEMEKLSDELSAALSRVAALEEALAAANRDTQIQSESFRREISAALQDRDRALKECSDLKAPHTPTISNSRQDNSMYHLLGSGVGKDGFANGQHNNDSSLEKLQGASCGGGGGAGGAGGAGGGGRAEGAGGAGGAGGARGAGGACGGGGGAEGAARLRAELQAARRALHALHHEAEVSKRRRDWAFSERDKIVQERESIRTLCDRLRKERDRAVSDLAEALRDSDDIKKQRNEIANELKELKDKLESELEKEPERRQNDGLVNIMDYDVQDIEWERLEVIIVSQDGDLGIELCLRGDNIYVTKVLPSSPAYNKIREMDVIVGSWSHAAQAQSALRALWACGAATVLRRARAHTRRATLPPHALTLHTGIFVSKIASGSQQVKDELLCVGDRVVAINNRSVENMKSVSEAIMLLKDCQYNAVTITVSRPFYPSHFQVHYTTDRLSTIRDGNRNIYSHGTGKMVNSCSQTEEPFHSHLEPKGERRYVYRVAPARLPDRPGAWDMIRGTIEAVTGRSKSKDKQNKVPESDAIAELDSVIDSYHGKTPKESSSNVKRSRRKNKDSQNDSKNGGTWPKARANFILEENPTGTIVQPRSRKERPPLSILLSPPTKLQPEPQRNTNRNSNPIPLGHQPLTQITAPARHSVYKTIETAPANFPKPAPLSIHNPFALPNTMNFDKMRTLEKDKNIMMDDYSEHDLTPNRLSLALNPSDDSLDYQPVSRNRNKSPHSLDFIVNKGPSSLDFVSRKSPSSLEHSSTKNHQGKDILEQYYSNKKPSSPKTVCKYPSDSDSFGPESLNSNINIPMAGTLPSQSRLQSQYYRGPFTNSHPHSSRYNPASPTNIPQSQSGESIGASFDMPSFTSHAHNMSDLQPVSRNSRAIDNSYQTYEGGTFPRKKENQRFRIPSNPSVTSKNSAGKLSTGSIERSSERNSPMPTFHVEVLSPGRGAKQLTHKGARNSMPEYCGVGWNKPLPGELRRVHIDKSQQPLGIQISCPPGSGGVFVSTVNENSLASQVGLQIGDQLLEVCGINMRSANYTLAANVLRQCGNSITMLVQYSPDKYKYEVEGSGSSSSGESSHDEEVSLSGSPTPRNSPGPQSMRMEGGNSEVATLRQSGNKELSRFLLIEMRNCSDLGISLVGGNAVGIFVHSVQVDSPAYNAGLRTGDQILEYNNVDLRHATAEQAALELAKPADKVSVLVRHDLQQYHEIKDKPGDAFYIRAGFDRCAKVATSTGMDSIDPYSLWFRKDEVLFVDNTLFNGAPGLWRAWQLDYKGVKQQWGTIPSKFKVEELLRRWNGSLEGCNSGGSGSSSGRTSSVARRSFFRRKKPRDSKELASFSNTELGWYAVQEPPPPSYQRVERLLNGRHRPVVVLGPMWESVVNKVVSDWESAFCRLLHSPASLPHAALERALQRGDHLEPRRVPNSATLHTIPTQRILDCSAKGIHAIIDISVTTIEKLHKQQIYPIVLLIKFKSTKQIKEVKDTRYPSDKVSAKAAKEMYEHALKLETEYRNYISAIIPAGVNIAYMSTQLKSAVEDEQIKTLWVPSIQA